MRLPKRTRGVVLGALALAAGPAVAIVMAAGQSVPVATVALHPLPAGVAVTVEQHEVPRMLRSRPPIPQAPTPRPAPPVHRSAAPSIPANAYSPTSVEGIIAAAANRWGVSATWMINIARCESGLRPNAYNPHGPYYGLFQFLMSTFTHNGGTNIWDPADQANIAAKMLAHGQAWQWSCA